jgi:hypothetical protein
MKFVHIPKPRQFNFKPRYYDKKKDELQQRIAMAEGKYVPGARIKFNSLNKRPRGSWSTSIIRIAIMLVLILALLYFAKSKGYF